MVLAAAPSREIDGQGGGPRFVIAQDRAVEVGAAEPRSEVVGPVEGRLQSAGDGRGGDYPDRTVGPAARGLGDGLETEVSVFGRAEPHLDAAGLEVHHGGRRISEG